MAGATTSFYAWAAACAGEVEFITSAHQTGEEFVQHTIKLSTRLLCQGHELNHEGTNWNLDLILQLMKMVYCKGKGLYLKEKKVKRDGYMGIQ